MRLSRSKGEFYERKKKSYLGNEIGDMYLDQTKLASAGITEITRKSADELRHKSQFTNFPRISRFTLSEIDKIIILEIESADHL